MRAGKNFNIIDVNSNNVGQTGFFCFMSKRKAEGFRFKLNWLKQRFAEGMRIKMFELPERGFIEYIPGEYAWRTVKAQGYMMIHCLWVVGKSKGKGLGGVLIEECIKDAKASGMKGVAMVTSEKVWLVGKKMLLKHGFESVEQAPPTFNLMVKKFVDAPSPTFSDNWEEKARRFGQGLTVIHSHQCPYIPDATNHVLKTAEELGIQSRVIELKSSQDVRKRAPSPYGVFSIVYDGRLLSYHYLLSKDLIPLIQRTKEEPKEI
jgi:N-acetylglutamate synthase-like GNAT family acetyltransferase